MVSSALMKLGGPIAWIIEQTNTMETIMMLIIEEGLCSQSGKPAGESS